MKTYLRNYEVSRTDVWAALAAWRSGESGHKNGHRVAEEYGTDAALVEEIYEEMRGRRLTFRPIRRYRRMEPTNGKVRTIGVESVKQQVCDYLVTTLLADLYDARLGFYQVASVRDKGQRLCRGALRRWVREGGYHVKLDVRKCYPSTRKDVAMAVYTKYVGSEDVLYVISAILGTYGRGLEIGSLFSLRTMQLVLSFGYHHVESLHKERRGRMVRLVAHQIWHMDDVLLTGPSKRDLKMAVRSLERYLSSEFGLTLKPWKVARTCDAEPLDLGGWVVRERRATIRGATFLRGMRSFRDFERRPTVGKARRCTAYWGWFANGDNGGVMHRNHMGSTFAHARSLVSRAERP